MSKQKLIEKLKELHKLCGNVPQVCIVDKAIDLIKSHDFAEPQWRSCVEDIPVTNRDVALMRYGRKRVGYRGTIDWFVYGLTNGAEKFEPTKSDLWHDLPPEPVPQPSEEVRAIEAEIAQTRKEGVDSTKYEDTWSSQQMKESWLWVLEQRLKEAKGER